ncbi:MAG: Adenosyl-chloride synthase [Calditrichaeota bacterium]|nr:Adenosyl-chloride synthase [Calditrichota bacterium]
MAALAAEAPVVALLTDFGLADDYVGQMHARILTDHPGARIVDLCHDVAPGDIAHAAFLLLHDAQYFPAGTAFVAVVDPGVGTERDVLLVDAESAGAVRWFVSPDNGLLDPVIDRSDHVRVRGLDLAAWLASRGMRDGDVSATFHGRDVLAPIGADLAAGYDAGMFSAEVDGWMRQAWRPPSAHESTREGRIMYADRFGNLITDIPVEESSGTVYCGEYTFSSVRTFADIEPGAAGWLRGSKGTVEIARNGSSAAEVLGLGPGEPVTFSTLPRGG